VKKYLFFLNVKREYQGKITIKETEDIPKALALEYPLFDRNF